MIIERLHDVMRPFLLRRVKQDVLTQLPDKEERVVYCSLSGVQAAMYSQCVARHSLLCNPIDTTKAITVNTSNTLVTLRKVCNHPYLMVDEFTADARFVRCSGKFLSLYASLHALVKLGHRVLLFSQMTTTLDLIEYLLGLLEMPYFRLDGSTDVANRRKDMAAFNDPDCSTHVFLLTTRAGGVGVNLQGADTIILFDSDFNPQMDLQAQDRAHRYGQTRNVLVLRFVSRGPGNTPSVEQKMLRTAAQRLRAEASVIGAGRFDQSKATTSTKQHLLREILSQAGDVMASSSSAAQSEHIDVEELSELCSRTDEERPVMLEHMKQALSQPLNSLEVVIGDALEGGIDLKAWEAEHGEAAVRDREAVADVMTGPRVRQSQHQSLNLATLSTTVNDEPDSPELEPASSVASTRKRTKAQPNPVNQPAQRPRKARNTVATSPSNSNASKNQKEPPAALECAFCGAGVDAVGGEEALQIHMVTECPVYLEFQQPIGAP